MTLGGKEERRRPAPLSELIDDAGSEELAELERVDGILRSVQGPPPALPPSLRNPAPPPREPVRLWTRRRTAVALAFAAVVAVAFFGLGRLTGGESFDAK